MRTAASGFVSSTGSSPSGRVRSPRGTFSAAVEKFDAVPFFWSQHYDVTINYVGHAERWDSVTVDGSLEAHDATVTFLKGTKALATATVYRDLESLKAEAAFERG